VTDARGAWLVLLLCFSGCGSPERRDAAVVTAAIARFRSATFAETRAAVEALAATPCAYADSCAARDACVASGVLTSNALGLKAEVEHGLRELERGKLSKTSPEAEALPRKLDEAEALLARSKAELSTCDERTRGLRRRHRL
jgi:hypothetical protein